MELAKGFAPYAKYPPMKVLILTIQEDPPSLDSYEYGETGGDDDDDEALHGEEQYSSEFSLLTKWLLQKSPHDRPTCQEVLQSRLFANLDRVQAQDALQRQVCHHVPDVPSSSSTAHNNNSTHGERVSILLTESEDRPAGTTWVFADGSQVLASDASTSFNKNGGEIDDVLQEFDDFCGETGGENYQNKKQTDNSSPGKEEEENKQEGTSNEEEEDDDLDDFMNEFEQTTGGEDFRQRS